MGVACDVVAPSLIPKGASDRVKTDRRDSARLALTHRAGLLTAIRVPSPAPRRRGHRGRPRARRVRVGGDDQLTPPRAGGVPETTPRQEMIPVNVLSGPILAVSEGYRPAHSRSADPTRAYEPGSGDSHDHAPARRPHPPRPPPHQGRSRRAGEATRLPLRPPGCCASRCARQPCGLPWTPETSAAAAAGNAGRPEPAPCRRGPAGNSRRRAAFPVSPRDGLAVMPPISREETPITAQTRACG